MVSPKSKCLSTINVIKREATVYNLEQLVLEELHNILHSNIVVVYLCAGINELTFKEYNAGGVQIVLHTRQSVVDNLISLKHIIRRSFPRSVVGLAIIPIISFKYTQAYNKKIHHLNLPTMTRILNKCRQTSVTCLLRLILC